MSKKVFIKPYAQLEANLDYNRLFCDDPELFSSKKTEMPASPWNLLLTENPPINALREIAADEKTESRLKILVYNALRNRREPINIKEVLGVVVEVGADEGLEVLAVYRDYRAHFIDYTGKLSVWKANAPGIQGRMQKLFISSRELIDHIRPWNDGRLTPPIRGMVRLTFLATDGLYFGQGPESHLQKDEMGGAIIRQAQEMFAALMQQDQELGEKK